MTAYTDHDVKRMVKEAHKDVNRMMPKRGWMLRYVEWTVVIRDPGTTHLSVHFVDRTGTTYDYNIAI